MALTNNKERIMEYVGNLLLFCLVYGMSATVDTNSLVAQLNNKKAIATGVFLQFVVLPFLGYAVVEVLDLNHAMGLTLLVVTSSPGGSYSNWWCSMFNADLALSVTMTAISTILSVITLPVNLLIYASLAYDDDVLSSIDWEALFLSLVVVISAITLGLYSSHKYSSQEFNMFANKLGNLSGIGLVLFSALLSNSDAEAKIWDRDSEFFLGVAAPCVLGLIVANIIATTFSLKKPERVTVSIECCYQNVGIATSVAITMFDGDQLAEAMGVPFYYGLVEAVILGIYCVIAWKSGWTKAPPDVPFWQMISTSYEVLAVEEGDEDEPGSEAEKLIV